MFDKHFINNIAAWNSRISKSGLEAKENKSTACHNWHQRKLQPAEKRKIESTWH